MVHFSHLSEGWDMRVHFWIVAAALHCGISCAMAGIAVSSIDTQAETNAYAPLDKSQYYDVNNQGSASPATATVSDNWSGTNSGGSSTTWNMVSSAQISTTTTSTPTSLSITGAGSFSYNITTTAGFVDPSRSATLYIPGAGGDYQCYFTIDTPAKYSLSDQLNPLGNVYFASFQNGVVFQQVDAGGLPITISQTGTITPGEYEIRMNASDGGPAPLANGVNRLVDGGSFTNFSFTVQVPEPSLIAVWAVSLFAMNRRIHWPG